MPQHPGQKLGPEFEHVTVTERVGTNPKWICKYCEKPYTGTASRISCHLRCSAGGGIAGCPAVPAAVKKRFELLEAEKAAKKDIITSSARESSEDERSQRAPPTSSSRFVARSSRVPLPTRVSPTYLFSRCPRSNRIIVAFSKWVRSFTECALMFLIISQASIVSYVQPPELLCYFCMSSMN